MSKSFGIIERQKNKKKGWQIVYFYLWNYFHRNGFELDKYEVKGAWFENREDAECELLNLQYASENLT
jgi:hypothetical protein